MALMSLSAELKPPPAIPTFSKLPDEIIELILSTCDPNSFASLVLLNRKWRAVSQQAHLYARQLARSQSYAKSHPFTDFKATDDDLPMLRKTFTREVKRNLYEAFLRPQETLIRLVSTSISSSAALPGGEAFHFAFSANGQYVLAYSTSRIHVLHLADSELTVERELKILRRPASLAILDDGSILAVLSTDHQVDIYDLREGKPKHTRAIALDHHPRTISLSPDGSVLAAAYDGGIEVYPLAATALATDKRGVKSDAVDHLSFSKDGTQLLGTTLQSKSPGTVILTAPYFNPGEHSPEDTISQLWTTSILFPNSSRDCSHAILLPHSADYEINWTFTYDRVFETFRAVRIDDLRNGTTYFTGPSIDSLSPLKLLPNTMPATTGSGDLVAAGFKGREIWLYGVPEDLNASSGTVNTSDPQRADVGHSILSASHSYVEPGPGMHDDYTWPNITKENRLPQWQLLRDRTRNTFVEGYNASTLDGITTLNWVKPFVHSSCERLIATAPGGVSLAAENALDIDENSMAPMDGGRILLVDFRYSIMNGQKRTITIEVGEKEPEILEEEHRDLETEVAIVRRRTVAQNRVRQQSDLRSSTTTAQQARQLPPRKPISTSDATLPSLPRIPSTRKVPLSPMVETSETSSMISVDEQEALDAPYAHGAPRSGTTLRRAATAAAMNRGFHPSGHASQEPPRMRPADGRNELPHESDADNWVPPPPPYSRDAVSPLPEHLRNAIPVGITPANNLRRSSTQRSSGSTEFNVTSSLHRSHTTYNPVGRTLQVTPPPLVLRSASVSPAISATSHQSGEGGPPPPGSVSNIDDFDDLYDVSPQRTPEPRVALPSAPSPTDAVASRRSSITTPAVINAEAILVNGEYTDTASPQPHLGGSNTTAQTLELKIQQQDDASNRMSLIVTPSRVQRSLTQSRLNAETPPRPNGDHHIMELPTITMQNQTALYDPSTQLNTLSQPSHNVEPITFVQVGHADLSADLSLPSAVQLARLNSRSARPNSRMLIDPTRRGSGTFSQPQISAMLNVTLPQQHSPVNANPHISMPVVISSGPPRAAVGAYGSPTQFANKPPSLADLQNRPNRSSSQRGGPSSSYSPNSPRPGMARLETIHSMGSYSEPLTQITSVPRPVPVGVSKQTSRAERSAAINMQDAKRNGWRGTTKRKGNKTDREAANTSAGGDVMGAQVNTTTGKRTKGDGVKCSLM